MAHEEFPPLNITPGAIRFNTDSMKLEYFRIGMEGGTTSSYAGIGTLAAGEWVQITTDTPDIQTGGTRGVLGGMLNSGYTDKIEYINIDSTGNAIDYGDLSEARGNGVGGCSSRTRGIFLNGYDPGTSSNIIDYITISSTGDAIDFGDSQHKTEGMRAGGNQTRGISHGGSQRANSFITSNTIDYITFSSTGNAQDFGDIAVGGGTDYSGACSSPVRVLFGGGNQDGGVNARISFVTTSTQGNSAVFGDLTVARAGNAALSNSTRGIWACGGSAPSNSTIEYLTLATLGNSQDFGDTNFTSSYSVATASPTRGVIMGIASLDYITISTTGNAVDFGDNGFTASDGGFISNGHGGLG